ncbi:hypothetical protein [Corynebacterium sp.]|nr:hypothetical protein [Corynebacterium sp.]
MLIIEATATRTTAARWCASTRRSGLWRVDSSSCPVSFPSSAAFS